MPAERVMDTCDRLSVRAMPTSAIFAFQALSNRMLGLCGTQARRLARQAGELLTPRWRDRRTADGLGLCAAERAGHR